MLADRGYFSGEEIVACEAIGVTPYVPKPLTSGAKAVAASASRILPTCLIRTSTAARPARYSLTT